MKIVIFDINRLSFEGGAEKYFSEVGEIFGKKGNDVYFIGDCRPVMKLFIWLSVFMFINRPWKLPRLFSDLKKVPPLNKDSKKYISFFPLRLRTLIPFSPERKKIRRILNEADKILIKNEIFELLFFWLLNINNKRKYIVVFTPVKYPEVKTIRARVHNYFYQSKLYIQLVKNVGQVIVSNKKDEILFKDDFGLRENNIFNIPYGLSSSYFAKQNEIVGRPNFQILFAGRMEEQKGISFLKEIIENINMTSWGQKINFLLAGRGPMETVAEELSEYFSNVEYQGQVSPEKLRRLYLCSDLVVMPSKWESFPYVCLEAQVCGCPVVAFNIPGPADIVEKNTGILVPLGKIKDFQESIYYYAGLKAEKQENYLRIRNEIAKVSAKKYAIENTVDNLAKLIQNVNVS